VASTGVTDASDTFVSGRIDPGSVKQFGGHMIKKMTTLMSMGTVSKMYKNTSLEAAALSDLRTSALAMDGHSPSGELDNSENRSNLASDFFNP
jgi:hypothetical protein